MKTALLKHPTRLSIGVASAVIGALGGAFLEATTDVLKPVLKPQIIEAYYSLEDWWSPITSALRMHLDLRFYAMSPHGDRSYAATGLIIQPKDCLDPNWQGDVKAYFTEALGTKNQVIMEVSCRASGRLIVNLLGQSGSSVTIYNGPFRPDKRIAFAGQPGSYNAGVLQLIEVSNNMPTGPRVPVNKCLIDDSCDFENLMPQREGRPSA